MPPLHELQRAFAAAMIEGKGLPSVTSMQGGPSWRSLALYRRLIRHNYAQALRITYSVLHRLIGGRYFNVFARGYLKRYPSTSGDLFAYGQHFPLFLLQLESPRLLIELARLEWACHELHQAADIPLPSQGWRQTLATVDPSSVTFRLNPTVRLLRCTLPVHRVWHALQPEAGGDGIDGLSLAPEEGGLLVTRAGGKIHVRSLSPKQWWLLQAVRDRKTVAEVECMANEFMPDLNLAQFLIGLSDPATGQVFSLKVQS
ncbi:MAG: DNA-binding domain-containing protein [Nitrospira sp.]|nr:DNA-binding domain-containing protein [Nitrospira sp.]